MRRAYFTALATSSSLPLSSTERTSAYPWYVSDGSGMQPVGTFAES
jgi:hypothetical protein